MFIPPQTVQLRTNEFNRRSSGRLNALQSSNRELTINSLVAPDILAVLISQVAYGLIGRVQLKWF